MELKGFARLPVALVAFALVASVWSSDAKAGATTTGLTFDLPAGFTLDNVYVATAASVDAALITDFLLPSGATIVGGTNISPPGFSVPTGSSSYNLVPLIGTSGAADNQDFAVAALFTDTSDVTHLVLGTSLTLTGDEAPIICDVGCLADGSTLDGWLTSGLLGNEGEGLENGVFAGLLAKSGFAANGSTLDLWEFSTGTMVAGASVTLNTFGTPLGTTTSGVPEPATLLLFSTGLLGLALAKRKRAA